MGTGRKIAILAIFWFSRKDIRPVLHVPLLTTCMAFWALSLKGPLEPVQSGGLAYPCRLERHFQYFDVSVAPRQGGNGHLYLARVSGSPKNTHQGSVVCLLVHLFEVNQTELLLLTHLLQHSTRVMWAQTEPCNLVTLLWV